MSTDWPRFEFYEMRMRKLQLGYSTKTFDGPGTLVDPEVIRVIERAFRDNNRTLSLLPRLRTIIFIERGQQSGWLLSSFLSPSITSIHLTIQQTNNADQARLGMRTAMESIASRCPSLRDLTLDYNSHERPQIFLSSFGRIISAIQGVNSVDISGFLIHTDLFAEMTSLRNLQDLSFSIDHLSEIPPNTHFPSITRCTIRGQRSRHKLPFVIKAISTSFLTSISMAFEECLLPITIYNTLVQLLPLRSNMTCIEFFWARDPELDSGFSSFNDEYIDQNTIGPLLEFRNLETFRTNIFASFKRIDDHFIKQIASSCPNLKIFDLGTAALTPKSKVTFQGLVSLATSCGRLEFIGMYFSTKGVGDFSLETIPGNISTTHLGVGNSPISTRDVRRLAELMKILFPKLEGIIYEDNMYEENSSDEDEESVLDDGQVMTGGVLPNTNFDRWMLVMDLIKASGNHHAMFT